MNDITRVLIRIAMIIIPFCIGFVISKFRIKRKRRKSNRNGRIYPESVIRDALSKANETMGSVTFAGEEIKTQVSDDQVSIGLANMLFESLRDGDFTGKTEHPDSKSDTSDVVYIKPVAKLMTVQKDSWFKRFIRRYKKKRHSSEFEAVIQAMGSPNTIKLHEGPLTSDSITATIKFDKER